MYKYILQSGGNINWLALIALITFLIVFSLGVYLVFRKDKELLKHISELPLTED